jgi:amino acid permease
VTLVTEVTVMSQIMRTVLGSLSMTPRFGRILRTLLVATVMGLLTWIARLAGVPLAGLVAVAAVIYLPGLFLLGVITPGEVKALLRRDAAGIVA